MKILGIFRGFPGLGRVVAGVSLLEELRDEHGCEIRMITYLQGNKHLKTLGYTALQEATPMDYCSLGLLPTNKMGVYIHNTVKEFNPDIVLIDGEPLIVHSLKLSYPSLKVIVLLNSSDVDNPTNDKEAMDYFNSLYSMADVAIVHGFRKIQCTVNYKYKALYSINTILRKTILTMKNNPTSNIYCVLGGGTVNVGHQFVESSKRIAELCVRVAVLMPDYQMHIVCSSDNIFDAVNKINITSNVIFHKEILQAEEYYSKAALIITRSGRNTLSELGYLGIPAISFIAGDTYRISEQTQNINALNSPMLIAMDTECSIKNFHNQIRSQINKRQIESLFMPGNDNAIDIIKSSYSNKQ